MKTSIKLFVLLVTSCVLFSCQPEQVVPSDVQSIQRNNAPAGSASGHAEVNTAEESQNEIL